MSKKFDLLLYYIALKSLLLLPLNVYFLTFFVSHLILIMIY